MKTEIQIERLYQELDRELDHFPKGSRFFSVRQILSDFNCHRGVLDSVLGRMEENGLITRVPQVGLFSNVSRKPEVRRILFAAPDWPSALIQEWAHCASNYAEISGRWQLHKTLFNPEREKIPSLQISDYDAAIIMHGAALITCEELVFLAKRNIPAVLLNVDTRSFEVSCVNSTDDISAMEACEYLVRHGHIKLAIVQSEPPHPVVNCRIRNFCSAARMLGAHTELIDCHCAKVDYSRHRAYEGVKEYLAERRGNAGFTAVYAVSGESVAGIMAALRESGYSIPGDISIIGHASSHEGEFLHPPLTVVCTDIEDEVRAAFSGIERCLAGEHKYFHTLVPTRLLERESVRTTGIQPFFSEPARWNS